MKPTLSNHALRSSERRWTRLSHLLLAIERGVEASARLDAYAPEATILGRDHVGAIAFNTRLVALEARVAYELDLLTAERLTLDLASKPARDIASTGH